MPKYDPHTGPDPREWLALDEQERIDCVRRYHKGMDLPDPL
jgi:hypothetical protein